MMAEMATLMEKQLEREDRIRAEMEAKLEQMREELTPRPAVTAQQLAALQSRLEAIHAAKLLTDDELFALEDICADFITLGTVTAEVVATSGAAAKLVQLVRVSEGIRPDSGFARQARRKFVV